MFILLIRQTLYLQSDPKESSAESKGGRNMKIMLFVLCEFKLR